MEFSKVFPQSIRHFSTIQKKAFMDIGLTVSQVKTLRMLMKDEYLTQRELAEKCGFDNPGMSRLIDSLVEKGFVTRDMNQKNRRSYLVSITESGREKWEEVRQAFSKLEKTLFEGLTIEEKRTFFTLLEKIITTGNSSM